MQLSLEEIRDMMEEVGCCIVGQTGQICPADKSVVMVIVTLDWSHTVLIEFSFCRKLSL